MTFYRYIVAEGDFADPLDYLNTFALDLPSGASVKLKTDRPTSDVDLTLPAPGAVGSLSWQASLKINSTAPYIVKVSSPLTNGTYGSGVSVPIDLTFSDSVVVTGFPYIRLNVRPGSSVASYLSGSGTRVLRFLYVVQRFHATPCLDYSGPNSLVLNGSSIKRLSTVAMQSAATTLPWYTSSLCDTGGITIHYAAPARIIEVTSSLPNGTYAAGHEIPIIVRFSQAVTLLNGSAWLHLDTGNALDAISINGSTTNHSMAQYVAGNGTQTWNFLYTTRIGDHTSRLNYYSNDAFSTNATLLDAFMNVPNVDLYPTAADARALNFSTNISLSSETSYASNIELVTESGTYGIGHEIFLRVNFSAPVRVIGEPKVQLQTVYLRPDAKAVYVNGSGSSSLLFKYTVKDQDWALGLPVSRSNILDYDGVAALNSNLDGASILRDSTHPTLRAVLWLPKQDKSLMTRTDSIVTIDPSAPVVLRVDTNTTNGTYGIGEVIFISVTFSSRVTVTGLPTLLLNTSANHEGRRYAVYCEGNNTEKISYSYTVLPGDKASPLDYADTRLAPYKVAVRASSALVVSNEFLSSRQLGNFTGRPAITYKRWSTHPTTDADVALPLPGKPGSLSYNSRIHVDMAPPTVLGVTTTATDGTYGSGNVIDIIVMFSAPVITDGQAVLQMLTGADDRPVPYFSGNGTANLTFQYVVKAGDNVSFLDYRNQGSLRLKSDGRWITDGGIDGYIKRHSTNPSINANLTLPIPGRPKRVTQPKSLVGNGHKICISTEGLVVAFVFSDLPAGVYGAGDEVMITVVFTQNVTVEGFPELKMNVAYGTRAVYVSGAETRALNFLYIVREGDDTGALDYSGVHALDFTGGRILGQATNVGAVAFLPAPGSPGSLSYDGGLIIDTIPPKVIKVQALTPLGTYGTGEEVSISVIFSQNVQVMEGIPELVLLLNNNAVTRARYVESASYGARLVFSYIVQEGDYAEELVIYDESSLILGSAVVLRASENPVTAVDPALPCNRTLTPSGKIKIDSSAPMVIGVTSTTPDGTYGAGDIIELQVAFSSRVQVFGEPVLELNSGKNGVSAYARYHSGSMSSALNFVYEIGQDDATSDLDYVSGSSLILSANMAIMKSAPYGTQDVMLSLPSKGSDGSLGVNSNIVIDAGAPRIAHLITDRDDGYYGTGTTLSFFLQFSKNVCVWQVRPMTLQLQVGNLSNASALHVNASVLESVGSSQLRFNLLLEPSFPSGRIILPDIRGLKLCGGSIVDCENRKPVNILLPKTGIKRVRTISDDVSGSGSGGQVVYLESWLFHDRVPPMVSGVNCSNIYSSYGFSVGDTVVLAVTFTAPVSAQQPTPTLRLNVKEGGAAFATFNSTEGNILFFIYIVEEGDRTEALDYYDERSLTGRIVRKGTNNGDPDLTLPAPGRRGSTSFSTRVRVDTSPAYITGLIPLKKRGTYVYGEKIFIVCRFSHPVAAASSEQLRLQLNTGSAEPHFATVYPYKIIAENMNFDILPTDLVFVYTVQKDDVISRLTHSGRDALNGSAAVFTFSNKSTVTANLLLADPDNYNSKDLTGQWLADYPKKVEVLIRDLWHEDAGDLQLVLTHGNESARLISNDQAGKTFGAPLKGGGYARDASQNETGFWSTHDGIGYDYFFSDLVGFNLAPLGVASQSSTMFAAEASRANDGNINGLFSRKSTTHTGRARAAEQEPWWELRLHGEEQVISTIQIWDRQQEESVQAVTSVTVAAALLPEGNFTLSVRDPLTNTTVTTPAINARAVARIDDEDAGTSVAGRCVGDSMEAKLRSSGMFGSIRVTREPANIMLGYTWSISFLGSVSSIPSLEVQETHIETAAAYVTVNMMTPDPDNDLTDYYNTRITGDTGLLNAWVMIFNSSVHPQDLGDLESCKSPSMWKSQILGTTRPATFQLEKGIKAKYVRIQKEGVGFLSFAELEVSPLRFLAYTPHIEDSRTYIYMVFRTVSNILTANIKLSFPMFIKTRCSEPKARQYVNMRGVVPLYRAKSLSPSRPWTVCLRFFPYQASKDPGVCKLSIATLMSHIEVLGG